MRIIGPPSATFDSVLTNLSKISNVHMRFFNEMIEPLWFIPIRYTIDPVGVIAQAAKETAYGNFTGKVEPEFHNTCGLKNSPEQQKLFPGITDEDNPLSHAMFAGWDEGVIAHVQHLRAYARYFIENDLIVDPRYKLVLSLNLSPCESFEDLSGKWTGASDYGQKIVEIARKLQEK